MTNGKGFQSVRKQNATTNVRLDVEVIRDFEIVNNRLEDLIDFS